MMKKLSIIGVLLISLLLSYGAAAEESSGAGASVAAGAAASQFSPLVAGAKVGLGFEWAARNKDAKDAMDAADIKNSAGFSGGGWLYVNYYLIPMLALQGGLGFVAKGTHFKGNQTVGFDHLWYKFAYMEFPLGAMLNIINIRITALLLIEVALTGKYKTKTGGVITTDKWGDSDWDNARRFNLGLRLGAGYAIPIGPVVLVPGVDWSTQFINVVDTPGDDAMRLMNFFFNVAVEYGLPI
jgi:hypothetical protein